MSFLTFKGTSMDKVIPLLEQQSKINEVRNLLAPLSEESASFCSDASTSRFLRAKNWDTRKASKMLKKAIKWRLANKPDQIHWEDIAQEAETGKLYKANYLDKYGRTVILLRPDFQNLKSKAEQIKLLVYSVENAVYSMAPGQDGMVWLIDFTNCSLSSISAEVMQETTRILQDYYPEMLDMVVFYNPPKILESFWKIMKPWMDRKTKEKLRFVYSNELGSQKIMEDLFDKEKLESAFGGSNSMEFHFKEYAERMTEEEKRKFANQKPDVPISLPDERLSLEPVVVESKLLTSTCPSSDSFDEASSLSEPPSPNSTTTESSDDKMQVEDLFSCDNYSKLLEELLIDKLEMNE